MSTETKVVTGIVIVTLLVIIGGIFLLGKGNSQTPNLTIKPELLQHADSPRAGTGTKVTIVEFADFECPSCAALSPVLEQLLKTDGDKFTLIYRHFPIHQHSMIAASAALAALEQGKFWEMSDLLFKNQNEWTAPNANAAALFRGYAQQIGLDLAKYDVSYADADGKHKEIVQRDQAEGQAMGINATPTLIINGEKVIVGAYPYDYMKQVISAEYAAANGGATSTATTTR